jgi:hypothetical protein
LQDPYIKDLYRKGKQKSEDGDWRTALTVVLFFALPD